MRVIGAGFGRTGTMSVKAALERLGTGPCYHAVELFDHPEHASAWEAAARGDPVDWAELLRGYGACVDWPGAAFYAELMEIWPEAPVLLTVRDPERWYESAHATIHAAQRGQGPPPPDSIDPASRRASEALARIVWDQTFSGRFEDRAHAIEVYRAHEREVRERVPSERLVVYGVGEGWGPLADLLGAKAPAEPFPHLNDTAAFAEMVRTRTAPP